MKYELPQLNYAYNALEPYVSREIMELHHGKHHQAYVDGANAALKKLEQARQAGRDIDQKSALKTLSFNLSGHFLHSIFWRVMGPAKETRGKPEGEFFDEIVGTFGSLERFKAEFKQAAGSVEGSGWAALVHHRESGLLLMQVEKHNLNYYPDHKIILPLDVWEHAYYLDYKNDKGKYIDAFWNVVNWEEVEKAFLSG